VPPITGCGAMNGRTDLSMDFILSTERLGTPGPESSSGERRGYVQKSLTYPTRPDEPTATCHLQPGAHLNALCGYQWEGLAEVPGLRLLSDVPAPLRCSGCQDSAAALAN
jgi:hypothetical protein